MQCDVTDITHLSRFSSFSLSGVGVILECEIFHECDILVYSFSR